MKTRKITLSALLIAIGVMAGSIIYIPVGASKCFPVQHAINIIAAVLLGPWYGIAIAFCISLLRNILATGTILAFPGSMIGAFLAGIIYMKTRNVTFTALGEIFGTGIIGGLLAFPIAKFFLGKNVAALFYVTPFLISTIGGSIIGCIIVKVLGVAKGHINSHNIQA